MATGTHPPPRNLGQWLRRLEELHPRKWDLGLERVSAVADRMGLLAHAGTLFLVAGTNGKGSVVALLEALARAHGYTTGTATSPHLLRFNERITLNGTEMNDGEICRSFADIDRARREISLTYFEFAALAALDIFRRERPDVIILEVGLGGRLDAMNIVSPDVAVVTSIDLDHQAWLGEDREAIGREKAGILRSAVPAVIGDPDPPRSLLAYGDEIGAQLVLRERDFGAGRDEGGWRFWCRDREGAKVRLPALQGTRLHPDNAAAAAAAWLLSGLRYDTGIVARALADTALPGRCQWVEGPVPLILDVAHNPHGARNLVLHLQNIRCEGATSAVVAMYGDKECEEFIRCLAPVVDRWYCAGLGGDRGQTAEDLRARMSPELRAEAGTYDRVDTAFRHARQQAGEGDRIVITGSFSTVAAVMPLLPEC